MNPDLVGMWQSLRFWDCFVVSLLAMTQNKMLIIKNLTKSFGEKKVIDDISLTVKLGEIVGFLGPNGAGKTTTMRLITGFYTPTEGKISIDKLSPEEARNITGYLPEENPLYNQFTPFEYLNFIAKMRGLTGNILQERLDYIIKNCNLSEVLNQKIETLSRGFRQRVGLAAALIHNPKLVVMDEPTSGLDPNQQEEIRKLIKVIAKEKAIIFSTHILSEAKAICKRVVIIHKGKIVSKENLTEMKKKKLSLEKLFKKLTK